VLRAKLNQYEAEASPLLDQYEEDKITPTEKVIDGVENVAIWVGGKLFGKSEEKQEPPTTTEEPPTTPKSTGYNGRSVEEL
jgi:hypothetical protein